MEILNNNAQENHFSFTELSRSKKDLILTHRSSAHYFVRAFNLKAKDADQISWFIFLLNGECNSAFVDAMEHWVCEVFLLTGSVQSILDAIENQWLPEVNEADEGACASILRKVIQYVQAPTERSMAA